MLKNYISIKERLIEETYNEKRKNFDKIVSLWVYYVTRPFSFLLTPFFIIWKISANFATLIGFFFGLSSFAFCILGRWIESAIFYNLFLIFDSIDGNIARLETPTKNGEYYDAITGDIINFLFIPFIGLGMHINDTNLFIHNDYFRNNIFSVSLIASLFHLLSVLISQRKKIIFNIKNGPIRIGNDKNVSIIEYLIRNSFGFAFNAPMSIIFTFFGVLDLLIIYNLSIMPLLLVFTIFRK